MFQSENKNGFLSSSGFNWKRESRSSSFEYRRIQENSEGHVRRIVVFIKTYIEFDPIIDTIR